MKKVFIGIGLLLIVAIMLYLTKPKATPVSDAVNQQTATQEEAITLKTHDKLPSTSVSSEKCDSKSIDEALERLKKNRNQAIKALAGQQIEAKELSQLVKLHLSEHFLSQEIYKEQVPKQALETAEQKALNEFNKQRPVIEEMMMSAFSGQPDQYLDKFLAGKLTPLSPDSQLHKTFIVNITSMGGDKNTLHAINRLYPNDTPLNTELVSGIIQSIKEPRALKQLLARVPNINQPTNFSRGIYGSHRSKTPIHLAVINNNFEAAQIMLELGAKPIHASDPSMNHFPQVDEQSVSLIKGMLDRGFAPTSPEATKRLADSLIEIQPDLSARLNNIGNQLKAQLADQFANSPAIFQQIVTDYNAQYEPLQEQYLQCLAQEKDAKPKIPPYRQIDKKQIEQDIDQLVAQKTAYEQIIALLAATNKETVEHGYRYLENLRLQQNHQQLDMMNMPKELRTLIGLIKNQNWDEMVDFLEDTKIESGWQITPATMLPIMIEKQAPESAISAMAEISNKNDTQLLGQALHNTQLLDRIANYGFNLDATDQSNKNLFYQAVKSNKLESLDLLINHGVSMSSDPYGYDPLDYLLRKSSVDAEMLTKLSIIGFPLTEHHLDYVRYLKSHYPKRYEKIIQSWPDLKAEGQWQPKS